MKPEIRVFVGMAAAFAAAALVVGCGPRAGIDGGNIGIDSGGGLCGNGTVDPGEQCEPPGTASCDMTCMTIGAVCGNGVVEVGEQCDPPNGTTCTGTCQNNTVTMPANPGEPCTADSECSTGGGIGLMAICVSEAMYGFPGGYCLVAGCTVNPMTGADDCPSGSHCEGFGDGMGGTVNYCLPDCNPGPTGIDSCRTDVAGSTAYTCLPSIIDPASGGCWVGCENDEGCNGCDTMAGNCFGNTAVTCATDADCTDVANNPERLLCNTTVNLCYADHTAGAAGIGDPCLTDLDCPQHAFCAGMGDPADAVWPGGYCTLSYCDTFASIPEFQCPAGSVCPSSSGFFGGLLQLCAAPCNIDTADTTGEAGCDTNRGDNFHYVCIENSTPTMSLNKLFDTNGAPGFCFQCDALFGTDPACP